MKLVLACALLLATAQAQTTAPLPPNYKQIFLNPDVLVQQVHYGPHESVPVHDHPAVTTVFFYLNDSGVVDIIHAPPESHTIHRPPTHTGAFRVSPGGFERHSVLNTSDLPSDFYRIELRYLPVHTLPAEFRAPAPTVADAPATTTLYNNPHLRIERTLCGGPITCSLAAEPQNSLILSIPLPPNAAEPEPPSWLQAGKPLTFPESNNPKREILRIVVLKP